MPAYSAWRRYNLETVRRLSRKRGIYEIASQNKTIIYRGGSDDEVNGVRGRLITHLLNNKFPTGRFFRCKYADFLASGIEIEGLASKRHVQRTKRKPKYNKRSPRVVDWYDF